MTESEKAILRAEKAIEAIASEIEAIHFRCWTLELAQPDPTMTDLLRVGSLRRRTDAPRPVVKSDRQADPVAAATDVRRMWVEDPRTSPR
jgi:hypothetical protein